MSRIKGWERLNCYLYISLIRIKVVVEVVSCLQKMIDGLAHKLASEIVEGFAGANIIWCLKMQSCLVIVDE